MFLYKYLAEVSKRRETGVVHINIVNWKQFPCVIQYL